MKFANHFEQLKNVAAHYFSICYYYTDGKSSIIPFSCKESFSYTLRNYTQNGQITSLDFVFGTTSENIDTFVKLLTMVNSELKLPPLDLQLNDDKTIIRVGSTFWRRNGITIELLASLFKEVTLASYRSSTGEGSALNGIKIAKTIDRFVSAHCLYYFNDSAMKIALKRAETLCIDLGIANEEEAFNFISRGYNVNGLISALKQHVHSDKLIKLNKLDEDAKLAEIEAAKVQAKVTEIAAPIKRKAKRKKKIVTSLRKKDLTISKLSVY